MSSNIEQALKHRPPKPLKPFFKIRRQKMIQYGDIDNKSELFKEYWQSLSQDYKDLQNKIFQQQFQQWKRLDQQWKDKYDICNYDLRKYKQQQLFKQQLQVDRQDYQVSYQNVQYLNNKITKLKNQNKELKQSLRQRDQEYLLVVKQLEKLKYDKV